MSERATWWVMTTVPSELLADAAAFQRFVSDTVPPEGASDAVVTSHQILEGQEGAQDVRVIVYGTAVKDEILRVQGGYTRREDNNAH